MRYWLAALLVAISVSTTVAQIGVVSEKDLQATMASPAK